MGWQFAIRIGVAVAIIAGCVAVGAAVVDVYTLETVGVGREVFDRMDEAGVHHSVTAVLLNFRAYDTLLEVVVLTVAFWGAWSLRLHRTAPLSGISDLLLRRIAALLVPLFVLLAAYLLWAGEHRPGGEFQAGAVLGAAGILRLLVGRAVPGARRLVLRQSLVIVGASVFTIIAAAGWVLSGDIFGYRQGWEPATMFIIELAATISIGFILVALFAGSVSGLTGDIQLRPVGPGALTGEDEVEYRTYAPDVEGGGAGEGAGDDT